MLEEIKAIIFDYDMTVADTLPFFEEAITSQFPGKLTLSETREIANRRVYSNISIETHNIRTDLLKMFIAVARENTNFVLSLWKTWKSYRYTKNRYTDVKPVDGAINTLNDLKTRGIRLAILSMSSRKKVEGFLENNSLKDLFDIVITKEEFSGSKTRMIKQICKQFRVDPKGCLMVGDLPGDITSAIGAGIRGVGVLTGAASEKILNEAGASIILPSIAELNKIVQ
ncbi:MAG: HAD family hydrolase [Candidatus Hodarchaeales archaeon]